MFEVMSFFAETYSLQAGNHNFMLQKQHLKVRINVIILHMATRKGENCRMQVDDLNLQELPLFHDLRMEEIEHFLQVTGAALKSYGKGERPLQIYRENTQIGVVIEGRLRVFTEDRSGNEVVGHGLSRGAMLGTNSAVLPGIGCNSGVEALSPVLILWIPYRALLTVGTKLGRIHGLVMRNIMESLVNKNIRMLEKIELLSQKNLRERLIVYLLQQERQQGTAKVQVPGRVQLAKELECNRSALTREISLMVEGGLLRCGTDWMQLKKDKI